MKNEKLVEATMLALRGKLNEWEEAYEDNYGEGITTRWYEVETDDGFLDTHFEDENEAIKVARTYKGNVFVYVTGSEKYTTGDYKGHSEPLDSVLLWQRKDGEEQKFGNSNAILEAKWSNKNRQGGNFATSFTDKKEARSHKEDNEKVAPRNKEQSFNGGPNKLSNKASGLAVGDKEKAETGISKALVGPEKGDIVGRDIKRNRVRSAEQALNRKNAGQLDFAGTTDVLDYEVSPNQKSREYRKAHGKITRESKKVLEGLSKERAEELIVNAIESVINNSDEDIEKMLKALDISKSELIEIGYDEDGSKNLLDIADKINQ